MYSLFIFWAEQVVSSAFVTVLFKNSNQGKEKLLMGQKMSGRFRVEKQSSTIHLAPYSSDPHQQVTTDTESGFSSFFFFQTLPPTTVTVNLLHIDLFPALHMMMLVWRKLGVSPEVEASTNTYWLLVI